jgi:very-short-patch-repair endonuclease
MFFACPILEEVPLPGSGGMRVDFYIPQQKLAVEVQGEQHFKYIPHFHGNRVNFAAAKRRDNDKARWFALNGIRLVAVSHAETPNEWQRRIAGQEDG